MELKIGMANVLRELTIDLPDTSSQEDISRLVEEGYKAGDGIIWINDKRGSKFGIPAKLIAYVEVSKDTNRRVGFGVSD